MPATLLSHESVEDPEPPVIVVTVRLQMRPVEFVVTTRVIVPLKPFNGATETIEVPAVLAVTDSVEGVAASLKSWT